MAKVEDEKQELGAVTGVDMKMLKFCSYSDLLFFVFGRAVLGCDERGA